MHSGRVPAKISTRRGFAVDPIPGGPIGSVRSRTTPSGDECNSSRIADARKRTAEVIFLAERTEPLISMRPALRQGQVRIILPTAAAAKVTNLFRTRHTYCSSDLLLSDRLPCRPAIHTRSLASDAGRARRLAVRVIRG